MAWVYIQYMYVVGNIIYNDIYKKNLFGRFVLRDRKASLVDAFLACFTPCCNIKKNILCILQCQNFQKKDKQTKTEEPCQTNCWSGSGPIWHGTHSFFRSYEKKV